MAIGFDPNDVEHHRLCDQFDDEARKVAEAVDGLRCDDIRCSHDVTDVTNRIATVRFTFQVDVVAALGEVDYRTDIALSEILNALPSNVARINNKPPASLAAREGE